MTIESDGHQDVPPQSAPASPLVAYYEGGLAARQCVERLGKEGKFSTPDWLQGELVERLVSLDPDLAKTWNLVKNETRRQNPMPVMVEWVHRVATGGRQPESVAPSVRQAVASLTEECLPLKGKVSKRNLNAWRLGVLDLRWQRGLSVELVAAALGDHFVRPAERTEAVEGKVLASLMRSSKAQLVGAALVVSWLTRLTSAQASELSRLRNQVEALQDHRAQLKSDLSKREAELEVVRQERQAAEEREAEARRTLVEAEDAATLRLHDVAGRAAGKLTTRIRPLLDQAEDALTMTEPSIGAAREFVETVRKESEELSQWLRAASTSEPPTV